MLVKVVFRVLNLGFINQTHVPEAAVREFINQRTAYEIGDVYKRQGPGDEILIIRPTNRYINGKIVSKNREENVCLLYTSPPLQIR